MSESDDKPFAVNDRRHFTADGDARPEAAPSEPAERTTEAPREAAAAPAPPAPEGRPRPPAGPPGFGAFLLSLGAQAGALLSGAGAEEGMSAEDALAHAQHIIAVLEMLEDKTEGRRTPEEDRLLADLLFQLRMAYVQKKQAGA